jgi:uncharacterized protein YoaH (UPF0181 family)
MDDTLATSSHGMAQRAVDYVFHLVSKGYHGKTAVSASHLEIYNEQVAQNRHLITLTLTLSLFKGV